MSRPENRDMVSALANGIKDFIKFTTRTGQIDIAQSGAAVRRRHDATLKTLINLAGTSYDLSPENRTSEGDRKAFAEAIMALAGKLKTTNRAKIERAVTFSGFASPSAKRNIRGDVGAFFESAKKLAHDKAAAFDDSSRSKEAKRDRAKNAFAQYKDGISVAVGNHADNPGFSRVVDDSRTIYAQMPDDWATRGREGSGGAARGAANNGRGDDDERVVYTMPAGLSTNERIDDGSLSRAGSNSEDAAEGAEAEAARTEQERAAREAEARAEAEKARAAEKASAEAVAMAEQTQKAIENMERAAKAREAAARAAEKAAAEAAARAEAEAARAEAEQRAALENELQEAKKRAAEKAAAEAARAEQEKEQRNAEAGRAKQRAALEAKLRETEKIAAEKARAEAEAREAVAAAEAEAEAAARSDSGASQNSDGENPLPLPPKTAPRAETEAQNKYILSTKSGTRTVNGKQINIVSTEITFTITTDGKDEQKVTVEYDRSDKSHAKKDVVGDQAIKLIKNLRDPEKRQHVSIDRETVKVGQSDEDVCYYKGMEPREAEAGTSTSSTAGGITLNGDGGGAGVESEDGPPLPPKSAKQGAVSRAGSITPSEDGEGPPPPLPAKQGAVSRIGSITPSEDGEGPPPPRPAKPAAMRSDSGVSRIGSITPSSSLSPTSTSFVGVAAKTGRQENNGATNKTTGAPQGIVARMKEQVAKRAAEAAAGNSGR